MKTISENSKKKCLTKNKKYDIIFIESERTSNKVIKKIKKGLTNSTDYDII